MPESKARRYHIVIDLYDHQSRAPLEVNPLLPKTSTRLPTALDRQLNQCKNKLVLLSGDFWRPLPRTAPLHTRNSSASLSPDQSNSQATVLSATTSFSTTRNDTSPRIWSQSTELWSPPAIATAELFTPSRAAPTASAANPTNFRQKAVLNPFFGPIELDWIDFPTPHNSAVSSTKMSPSNSSISAAESSRPTETSGTTLLNFGLVHLYREFGVTEESDDKEKRRAMNEDDGTVIGLVGVPDTLTAHTLLNFISPGLETISQIRILRDATPNRNLVLIKFFRATDSLEFTTMYAGRHFHDDVNAEVCQVVPISGIQLKSNSSPPFTFPLNPVNNLELSASAQSDLIELPTCPICLERLDVKISGIFTPICNHGAHCNCLLKWGDSRCPVCRQTNARTRKPTLSSSSQQNNAAAAPPTCTICSSPSNLWICVICAHMGCGRYQGGHAHSHYDQTFHSYALELETGRIWSYREDEYVHRLIRNKADGRLVELPSLLSNTMNPSEGKSTTNAGPDRSDEQSQDKLEAMGNEYTKLLTNQLESQREFYQSELFTLKQECAATTKKLKLAEQEKMGWNSKLAQVEAKWAKEFERVKLEKVGLETELLAMKKLNFDQEMERKRERNESNKQRKQLIHDLQQEQSVTENLSLNLGHLRAEVSKRETELSAVKVKMRDLKEQMRDVMFALTARDQIQQQGGAANEAAGGDLLAVPNPPSISTGAKKKKGGRR